MKIGTLSGPYSLTYYKGEQTAKELLDWDLQLTRWADEYGYNEVYYTEHYTVGSEPSPAPDLMIAAASQITTNVTLGAMGHLVPYHNPAALAFRLMWLDHMTGGSLYRGCRARVFSVRRSGVRNQGQQRRDAVRGTRRDDQDLDEQGPLRT